MKAFGYAFTKEDSDNKEFTPLLQFRCTQGFAPLYYTFDDDWQAEVVSLVFIFLFVCLII